MALVELDGSCVGLGKETDNSAFTAGSGFTLNYGGIIKAGNVAQAYLNVTRTTAATAGTDYTVATINNVAENGPVFNAPGVAISRNATAWINPDGTVHLNPASNYSANTNFYISFTYIPKGWNA